MLLLVLFITHSLLGAVELGTDGWIQNITGNILTSEQGKILFVFTSATMFCLRFCADFIERKIGLSPIGILLTCAVLACIGLNLTAGITSFGGALLALSIYGIGKTFFWPTMLAVASDRFPRTGAVAISIMGGIGMMSAGLVGSPGLGYAKDRFAGEELQKSNPAVYSEYKAATPSKFLFFAEAVGLDGTKLGAAKEAAAAGKADATQKTVHEADTRGDRRTLRADSFIPAIMGCIYLCLFLYFKAKGGYRTVHLVNGNGNGQPVPATAKV
jgi:MFS family permease